MTDLPTVPAPDGPPSTGFQAPERLGPVRLIRRIGAGGMGVVWLGHHELLNLSVAVKLLTGAKAGEGDDTAVATFVEGARAAVGVRSPALTAIHNADVFNGVPYLVMEFIDGCSLADLVSERPLPLTAALAALEAVCEGVGALHDHDIIHRDLKPANVLLDRTGRVAVTDFGLAFTRSRAAPGAPTLPFSGTPGYMAPELGPEPPSVRTDMYALGITAYVLVTGTLPWDGARPPDAPLPAEPLARHAVPEGVIDAIDRAVHAEARLRHKSVRNFVAALQRAVPDRSRWEQGRRELGTMAGPSPRADARAAAPAPSGSPSGYGAIESRAAAKRASTPAPPAPSPAAPSLPVGDVLIADLPCISCGYSLRGLGRDALCPECGAAVAATLNPTRLLFSDPLWLRRQQFAMTFLASLGLLLFLLTPGLMVLPIAATRDWAGAILLAMVPLAGPLLLGATSLLVARREPRAPAGPAYARAVRPALAVIGVITLAVGLSGLATLALGRPAWLRPLLVANSFCTALTIALVSVHIVGLTRRIPRPRLTRSTSAAVALAAATLAMIALGRVFIWTNSGPPHGLWLIVQLNLELLLLMLLVSVSARMRKELRAIRRSARDMGPLFARSRGEGR